MGTSAVCALRGVLLCAALAAAWPAGAQMYKWVDDKGVVTYSNALPPGTSQKKVEAVAERVSVYTPDAQVSRAMSQDTRRDAKIAGLERQLETERNARRAPAPANPDVAARRTAAYERCVAERGVDCEAIRSGTGGDPFYGYTGYYGPQFVVGARNIGHVHPFFVDPTPPPRIGVSTAPPVGISTAPPVGIDNRPPVGAPPRQRAVGMFR